MPNICIVIPCYNEASRLPLYEFEQFIPSHPNICFCFVDDGSIDNTIHILQSLKDKFPELVKIKNLSKNSGKAEAVRQGMLQSLTWKTYSYIGFLDADLAAPLAELENLIAKIEKGYGIVLGSRVKRLGATIERSWIRHYMGRVFATFASVVMNIGVYDSQCGVKLFDTRLIPTLFQEPFVSKWIFDVELLIRAKQYLKEDFYKSVYEMPLASWIGKKDSRIKVSYLLRVPLDLILIHHKYYK